MSSWSCPHEVEGICGRVAGAYCRPGMRGCILVGKVQFPDGAVPEPQWPEGEEARAPGSRPRAAVRRPDPDEP